MIKRPGLTVPLPGHLRTHQQRLSELAGIGRGMGATAASRHGNRSCLHPFAGVYGTKCRVDG